MKNTTIITYIGKGGTGKTILSALTGKIAISKNKKVLYIDADPAMGLACALGLDQYKTIGQAREEIINQVKSANKPDEKENITDMIDYLLLETLYESKNFSMLVMGQTNTIGCYCPINSLLKDTISSIANNYDLVIIDAEAGIEQINRQVVASVDYPIIVTDNSMRGVTTSLLIKDTIHRIKSMNPVKTGVIFNRVNKIDDELRKKVQDTGIMLYGSIPVDTFITESDCRGTSALELSDNASSVDSLTKILEKEEII